MSTFNIITVGNLSSCFVVDTVNQEIIPNLGPGLAKNASGQIVTVINTASIPVYHEKFGGGSTTGTAAGAWGRQATVTRTAVGRWTVTFASPHPDGDEYHPSLSIHESGTLRDVSKISVVLGTLDEDGFDIQITTDDNGGGADVFNDEPWSFGVACPQTVVTGVV